MAVRKLVRRTQLPPSVDTSPSVGTSWREGWKFEYPIVNLHTGQVLVMYDGFPVPYFSYQSNSWQFVKGRIVNVDPPANGLYRAVVSLRHGITIQGVQLCTLDVPMQLMSRQQVVGMKRSTIGEPPFVPGSPTVFVQHKVPSNSEFLAAYFGPNPCAPFEQEGS